MELLGWMNNGPEANTYSIELCHLEDLFVLVKYVVGSYYKYVDDLGQQISTLLFLAVTFFAISMKDKIIWSFVPWWNFSIIFKSVDIFISNSCQIIWASRTYSKCSFFIW